MSIRVGIIGLHHGVTVHLPAYASSAKFEVVAVCDRTPGLAEEVAQTHHVPHVYADAAQLIAASEVDVVSIATPPRTHVGLATAALKAGKHVVVETPFACNQAEVRALMGLWRLRRIGAPAYALRYAPHLRMVSDLLAQKKIGRPHLMRVDIFSDFLVHADQNYRWMWDGEYGGGVLANFTATMFDLALRWFGPVRDVTANLTTLFRTMPLEGTNGLADDTGFVTLRFETGQLAHFGCSAATAWNQTHIEVHGSEGSLLIDGFGEDVTLVRMGDGATEPLFSPENYLEESRGRTSMAGGFHVLVERLAEAIGGAPPEDFPTFADGLAVTRLVEAAKLSSRDRRTVMLAEVP
jgi:predicted dehydrogenase